MYKEKYCICAPEVLSTADVIGYPVASCCGDTLFSFFIQPENVSSIYSSVCSSCSIWSAWGCYRKQHSKHNLCVGDVVAKLPLSCWFTSADRVEVWGIECRRETRQTVTFDVCRGRSTIIDHSFRGRSTIIDRSFYVNYRDAIIDGPTINFFENILQGYMLSKCYIMISIICFPKWTNSQFI